jgi:hypothetical protein
LLTEFAIEGTITATTTENRRNPMNYTKVDNMVTDLIDAVISEQIAKGYAESDAKSYTLGYISSKLTHIIAFMEENQQRRELDVINEMISVKRKNARDAA